MVVTDLHRQIDGDRVRNALVRLKLLDRPDAHRDSQKRDDRANEKMRDGEGAADGQHRKGEVRDHLSYKEEEGTGKGDANKNRCVVDEFGSDALR